MAAALIALGSNLGERAALLAQAIAELRSTPGIEVKAVSRWRITHPIGGPAGQADFLNGAALLETTLPPEALLSRIVAIEGALGRVRSGEAWAPRTIDLDLLLYDALVQRTAELTLPHPRLAWRRFVLEPAAEIAANFMHPSIGWTIGQLADHVRTAAEYIAIAGIDPAANRRLAEAVLAHEPGQLLAAPSSFTDEPAESGGAAALPRGVASRLYLQYGALPKRDEPRPTGFNLSDFWFDQFADWSDVHLSVRWRPLYRQTFKELQADLLPAKLIVLLSPESVASPYAQQLRAIAARPGLGPVLHLPLGSPSCSWETAVAEVVAAIRAMR